MPTDLVPVLSVVALILTISLWIRYPWAFWLILRRLVFVLIVVAIAVMLYVDPRADVFMPG